MDQLNRAERTSHEQIELFLRFDRVGTAAGLLAAVLANAVIVREPAVYFIVPMLIGLMIVLTVALRMLRAGRRAAALWLATIGNWVIAVAVTFMFSFLWPVMVLTCLMPVVLAMPHLDRRQLVPFMVGALVVGLVICSSGLLRDDDSLIEDIDDTVEFVVVVGGLLAQTAVLGLLIWQGNQLQRQALNDALRLNRDLADSRVRLVEAGDRERSRIERDLHDGAQQRLAALGVRLRLFGSQASEHDRPAIDELVSELSEATAELRELAHGVYPPLLEQRGLAPAISAVVRRMTGEVELDLSEGNRFDRQVESALYFVCREALTNALKHGPEARMSVSLTRDDGDAVVLTVVDDGPGFDTTAASGGRGLLNMSDRLAAVGGRLELESALGAGTTVRAVVPEA